jgi:3'-5' exoribonuclease
MAINNYISELREMAESYGKDCAAISEEILSIPDFAIWSACEHETGHQYGVGGLAKHTYEVAYLCERNGVMSNTFGNSLVNRRILFLASLFHDVGKLRDYKFTTDAFGITKWERTPHKRHIHHISRSAITWTHAVAATGLCRDIEDDVLHCILSHHGRREWGSPVAPCSREAWILHLSDMLSARCNDCDRVDMVHVNKT